MSKHKNSIKYYWTLKFWQRLQAIRGLPRTLSRRQEGCINGPHPHHHRTNTKNNLKPTAIPTTTPTKRQRQGQDLPHCVPTPCKSLVSTLGMCTHWERIIVRSVLTCPEQWGSQESNDGGAKKRRGSIKYGGGVRSTQSPLADGTIRLLNWSFVAVRELCPPPELTWYVFNDNQAKVDGGLWKGCGLDF